jgi:hypothetical protein
MPRPGRTTARGYGTHHRGLRAWWAPRVARGNINCWRCGHPIRTGQAWDLGHDDHDRTKYRGPEHAHRDTHCIGNRAAGAQQRGRRAPDQLEAPLPDEPLEANEW